MSSIEFIFDKPVNYGALAYALVTYEHDFELHCVFFVGGIAEFFIDF